MGFILFSKGSMSVEPFDGSVRGLYLDVLGDVDLARPQVAEPGLFDQLTQVVGVGDPQGQAAAAGL